MASCKKDDSCIDPTKVRPNALCVAIYDPVCGCNEQTYGNSCEAEVEGITSWTEGECP